MNTYEEKCKILVSKIEKLTEENVIVAFSGGVDSSLLLKLAAVGALKNGKKVFAVTLHTTLHTMNDIEISKKVAEELGAEHIIIKIDEIANAGIMNNPVDRCYRCKKYLFTEIKNKGEALGIKNILEGTNADDMKMYRPGIKAIKELGIISPLEEAGFTKAEVRKLAGELGVSVSNRPSAPCLATRFPYGTTLSYDEMKKIEIGEEYLKNLGFYNVRLRVHGDILRIEVDKEKLSKIIELKDEIISFLKNLGYIYITIDLEGFRSGSMDIFNKEK